MERNIIYLAGVIDGTEVHVAGGIEENGKLYGFRAECNDRRVSLTDRPVTCKTCVRYAGLIKGAAR